MSQCNCSFLRSLWSCLIGSIKLILFLGSLVLLIFSIFNFMILVRESRNGLLDALPRSIIQLKLYAINLIILILSVIGIYGSFYSHQASLKAFSVLTAANALIVILIIATSRVQFENDRYFGKLNIYKEYYNWKLIEQPIYDKDSSLNYKIKQATDNWDGLQKYGCCGIHSYTEWDLFRPKRLSSNLYPKSCCHTRITKPPRPIPVPVPAQISWLYNNVTQEYHYERDYERHYCNINSDADVFHKTSCYDKVVQIEGFVFGLISVFVGIQLVLAVLASCIGYHHECTNNNRIRGNINIENPMHNGATYLSPPIQGNVWQVQQCSITTSKDKLASAPQLTTTTPAPNYYPNLNHVQRMNFPPRYGSVE